MIAINAGRSRKIVATVSDLTQRLLCVRCNRMKMNATLEVPRRTKEIATPGGRRTQQIVLGSADDTGGRPGSRRGHSGFHRDRGGGEHGKADRRGQRRLHRDGGRGRVVDLHADHWPPTTAPSGAAASTSGSPDRGSETGGTPRVSRPRMTTAGPPPGVNDTRPRPCRRFARRRRSRRGHR